MPTEFSPDTQRIKKYNVFVSYKHEDDDARAVLVEALISAGFETWWDAKLKSGNFRDQLREKINHSDVVIALWSRNASMQPDEIMFEMTHAFGSHKLLAVRIDKAPVPKVLSQEQFLNFEAWNDGGQRCKDQIDFILKEAERLGAKPSRWVKASGSPAISVQFSDGFPSAPRKLVGRDDEMQLLREAWEHTPPNAVVLHALGGVGKSALLRAFTNERLEKLGDGATHIYGWSAYSQGSGDQKHADADGFISEALKWFGYEGGPIRDSVDRALTLAKLIQQKRTLLLLDGLEPLQHPPGQNKGRLKDRSIAALIKALGNFNPGLLIITSRQPVVELEGMGDLVVDTPLNELSESAGADLLVELGVTGRQLHLEAAVREVRGHALSLTLLGTFIAEVCDGDIRQRSQFKFHKIIDMTEELEAIGKARIAAKHVRKVIEGYLKQFEKLSGKAKGNGGPERVLLNLLGLFDRPADGDAVNMLLSEHIEGLTDGLFFDAVIVRKGVWGIGRRVEPHTVAPRERGQRVRRALERLRKLRLLEKADPGDLHRLDAHPIIQAYFAENISKNLPEAVQLAHQKLYYHYITNGEEQPETLAAMQPLLHAIGHGVKAGWVQEAFFNVFQKRVLRSNNFLGQVLGAHETELAAAAEFFIKPWTVPHPDLPASTQASLLNLTATALMSVGRLHDAVEPRKAGLTRNIKLKNWRLAAYTASRLSTNFLLTGEINSAIEVAEKAKQYAEKSGDIEQRVLRRSELYSASSARSRRAPLPSYYQWRDGFT